MNKKNKKVICENCGCKVKMWGSFGKYKILCNGCYNKKVDNGKMKRKLIKKLNKIYLEDIQINKRRFKK